MNTALRTGRFFKFGTFFFAIALATVASAQTAPTAEQNTSVPTSTSAASAPTPLAISLSAAIEQYKICYDPSRNREFIVCGARECPTGTKYVKTVHDATPECNGSCVDMKALGWKKGNKTRFCTDRGYDGVIPASKHDYSKGGCCYKNPSN